MPTLTPLATLYADPGLRVVILRRSRRGIGNGRLLVVEQGRVERLVEGQWLAGDVDTRWTLFGMDGVIDDGEGYGADWGAAVASGDKAMRS